MVFRSVGDVPIAYSNQTEKLPGVTGTDCYDINRMALSATVVAYSTSMSSKMSRAIALVYVFQENACFSRMSF
jgi:hypothetical protein